MSNVWLWSCLFVAAAMWQRPLTAWAGIAVPRVTAPTTDLLNQILQFTYTIAHAVGQAITNAIQTALPEAKIPLDMVDPIGFLTVLTIFVLLAGVARRIAWLIVVVGWLLIGVRLVLVIMRR